MAEKTIPIGPNCWAIRTDEDLFIVYEGVKIARRGYDGAPDEGTWVSLQPGWEVRDVEDLEALEIHYDGDRMH